MNTEFDQTHNQDSTTLCSDKNRLSVGTPWMNEIILEDDFGKLIEESTSERHQNQCHTFDLVSQSQESLHSNSFDPFEFISVPNQEDNLYCKQNKSSNQLEPISQRKRKSPSSKSFSQKEKPNNKRKQADLNTLVEKEEVHSPDQLLLNTETRESSAELSDGQVTKRALTGRQFSSEEERLKYLKRRMNNNLAAKNSRKKKQEREEENSNHLQRLLQENKQLREELLKYQTEVMVTRQTLSMFIQSVTRTNPNILLPQNPYLNVNPVLPHNQLNLTSTEKTSK